ncbi:MAG: hypothetical protein R3351_01205, partial [Nitrospirales bacterium]|nr:hypothetical protein [Nitrospirales bacterium]
MSPPYALFPQFAKIAYGGKEPNCAFPHAMMQEVGSPISIGSFHIFQCVSPPSSSNHTERIAHLEYR